MKTKIFSSLLALVLGSALLLKTAQAQDDSTSGMMPIYSNPNTSLPTDSQTNTNGYGFNLNFIGDPMFPQTQDTFVPLTQTLEDIDADPSNGALDHPIVLTQRDAIENTTAENIITTPQGRGILVDLGETWVQASYDFSQEDYIWSNPWSFEKDNQNVKYFSCWWDGAWIEFPKISKNKLKNGAICQKWHIVFPFQSVALGEATLTFTRKDMLHAEPRILTFRFNIVATEDATASTEPASNND